MHPHVPRAPEVKAASQQSAERDRAACAALNYLLGGQPSLESKGLMTRFGYWDGEKLTDEGAEAAADASGVRESDA